MNTFARIPFLLVSGLWAALVACDGDGDGTGSPADAGSGADASGMSYGEVVPCASHAECESGVCLDLGPSRMMCAIFCGEGCAPGWDCEQGFDIDGEPVPRICDCDTDAEACNGLDDDCDLRVDEGSAICGGGELCVDGACVCPPERQCGGDACVDITSDVEHCGECGTRCAEGAACMNGQCTCDGMVCDGVCMDTSADDDNCGGCGVRCAFGASCTEGECVCDPEVGDLACDDRCIDSQHSTIHCGTCDTTCDVACSGGACAQVVDLSVGVNHACAALDTGEVRCWGNAGPGRPDVHVPHTVQGLEGVTALALGGEESCAVLEDRTATCFSRVGRADRETLLTPIEGLTDIEQLAGSYGYFCAVVADGGLLCWGRNDDGQLGTGDTTERTSPTRLSELGPVQKVALGASHACALLTDGTLRCWGSNQYGQLGTGDTEPTMDRIDPGLTDVHDVSAGSGGFTCAIVGSPGSVYCWGDASGYKLGSRTDTPLVPNEVPEAAGAVRIHSGLSTCASLADDRVICWGRNHYDSLGACAGSTDADAPPTESNYMALVRAEWGSEFGCGVTRAGEAKCWGYNNTGQIGVDMPDEYFFQCPVTVIF